MSRILTTSSRGASASYERQSSTGNGKDGSSAAHQDEVVKAGDPLLNAVNTVSKYVQSISREVHLYVDDSTGNQRVSIVDSSTGQTIRHVPAKELMDLSRHILIKSSDPIKGLLVKSEA
jgi:uncharacterized FlaG/YvyC family protein